MTCRRPGCERTPRPGLAYCDDDRLRWVPGESCEPLREAALRVDAAFPQNLAGTPRGDAIEALRSVLWAELLSEGTHHV